jgi:Subtilase family/Divergent InlB B-repeat domain
MVGVINRRFSLHCLRAGFLSSGFLALLVLAMALAPPVRAQSSVLTAEAQARLAAGERVRVLVEFVAPEVDFSANSDARLGLQSELFSNIRDSAIERALGVSADGMRAADPGSDGARIIREFAYSPGAALLLSQDEIDALAADPDVVRIVIDELSRPMLDTSIPLIGAASMHGSGLTGLNRTIAILDTGVDHQHPMFTGRFVDSACFSSTVANQSESFCPGGVSTDTSSATAGDNCLMESDTGSLQSNDCFHGTHVAGIAAGASQNVPSGPTITGVAPSSGIVAVQVFSHFNDDSFCGSGRSPCALAYNSDQVAALEWLNTNRVALNLASINMSLGGGRHYSACGADSRNTIISTLRSNGVATVISSGNNGYTDSVGAPGCVEPAVTVGSTTDSDALSGFSNSAPMVDLLAPGSSIQSATPTANGDGTAKFTTASGTSMAAPHVAGAFAVLMAANPGASVSDVENALEITGNGINEPSANLTKPRIQIDQAHSLLQGNPYLSVTPADTWIVSMDAGGSVSQSRIYTLTNHGQSALDWAVSDDQSWLTYLTAESGTLAAGASANVTFFIFSGNFPEGSPAVSQTANVTFTQTGGGADITRTVNLSVNNAPDNDNFADAIGLSGLNVSTTGSNVGATQESGEPTVVTNATNTVWWRWSPTATGEVEINTNGSDFDTVLGVFTGSSVNALTTIGTNDDSSAYGLRSQLIFPGDAGQVYHISIAGFNAATDSGNVSLNIAQTPADTLLLVSRSGVGSGTVNSTNDTTIRCGADCQEVLTQGNSIALEAIANAGSVFTGWSGDGANNCAGSSSTTCNLTLPAQDVSNVSATFSPAGYITAYVRTSGLGQGHVESGGTPICSGGTCFITMTPGSALSLTAVSADGSTFAGWTTGGCPTPSAATCEVSPAADTILTARFTDDSVVPTQAAAAVLPGARSGYVGGEVITALMTAVSGTADIQSCYVDDGGSTDVDLTYDLVGEGGQPLGLVDPIFDIIANDRVDLILSVTPLQQTSSDGLAFYPRLTCSNASASAIEDVNSLRLSISDAPGMDLLSIGVTPSGDGVVRIPAVGGTSFMAAAAMNIGVPENMPIRVVADTGAADLPVFLRLCETDIAGQCLTDSDAGLETVFSGTEPRFFGVFVQSDGSAGIPLDAANARVFLRFLGPDGALLSATSAALTSPQPLDFPSLPTPTGSWSILASQTDGRWPDFARGALVIGEDGRGLLDDGQSFSRVDVDWIAVGEGRYQLAVDGRNGRLFQDGRITLGLSDAEDAVLWGVRNDAGAPARSSTSDPSIFGGWMARLDQQFPGCAASVRDVSTNPEIFEVTLAGCEYAGHFLAASVPAGRGYGRDLLLANENSGWRITE